VASKKRWGRVSLLQQPILALLYIDGGYSRLSGRRLTVPSTRLPFRGSSLDIIPAGDEQDVMRKGRFWFMMWVEWCCGASLKLPSRVSETGGNNNGEGIYYWGTCVDTLNAGGSGSSKIKCVPYMEGSCICDDEYCGLIIIQMVRRRCNSQHEGILVSFNVKSIKTTYMLERLDSSWLWLPGGGYTAGGGCHHFRVIR